MWTKTEVKAKMYTNTHFHEIMSNKMNDEMFIWHVSIIT